MICKLQLTTTVGKPRRPRPDDRADYHRRVAMPDRADHRPRARPRSRRRPLEPARRRGAAGRLAPVRRAGRGAARHRAEHPDRPAAPARAGRHRPRDAVPGAAAADGLRAHRRRPRPRLGAAAAGRLGCPPTGDAEPLRHETCGTALEARWYCPTCAVAVDDADAPRDAVSRRLPRCAAVARPSGRPSRISCVVVLEVRPHEERHPGPERPPAVGDRPRRLIAGRLVAAIGERDRPSEPRLRRTGARSVVPTPRSSDELGRERSDAWRCSAAAPARLPRARRGARVVSQAAGHRRRADPAQVLGLAPEQAREVSSVARRGRGREGVERLAVDRRSRCRAVRPSPTSREPPGGSRSACR